MRAYRQDYGQALVALGWLYEDGYDFAGLTFELKNAEECYVLALDKYNIREARSFLRRLNDLNAVANHVSLQMNFSEQVVNPVSNDIPINKKDVPSLDHLQALIGLKGVKEQINRARKRTIFEHKRYLLGLSKTPQSNHFIFTGNPGTGKTEVARIIGALYRDMGLLQSGHVVEVDRSDLVAEYIGGTAQKTQEIINSALDGVLFIDEAYALYTGSERDFGMEALNVLIKAMEDYRENLIVILAGYPAAMDALMSANPGLRSRIRHHLLFEDYAAEELVMIYERFVQQSSFILDADARIALFSLMQKAISLMGKDFGNGRFARHVYEATIEKMAIRVVDTGLNDRKSLKTIMFMDIPTLAEVTKAKGDGTSCGDSGTILPFNGN